MSNGKIGMGAISPPGSAAPTCGGLHPAGLLTAIVESSDDAIIGLTSDGTIASWNRAAASLFGYPAAEALGRSAFITVGEPALELELRGLLDRIRRGGHVRHYETVRTNRLCPRTPLACITWR